MGKSNPLERAFKVLDIVASANREMSLVEIVEASGLPQSSTFRLASNLVESGLLSFDHRNKTYMVGPRTKRLALFVTGQQRLEEVLQPVIEQLAGKVRETAFFVKRTPDGNALLSYVVPEIGASSFVHPGFSFPIHATAAGKVIHAFSNEVSEPDVHDKLEKYQPQTITDKTRLQTLYRDICEAGYATNDGELDRGVYSVCAPVFFENEVAGALGVVGPRDRMILDGDERTSGIIDDVKSAAVDVTSLSKLIGYRGNHENKD